MKGPKTYPHSLSEVEFVLMCFQPQVLQTYSYTTTHRSVNLVVADEYAIQKDSSQSLCKLCESRCNQSDQENRYRGPWQTSTTCARRPHGLTGAFAKRLPSVFGNMTGGHASITMERWPGAVEHRRQGIVEYVGVPCLVR